MTANSMTVKKIAEKRMRRLFQLAEEEIRSSSQDLCEVQKTDPIHHTTTRKEEGIGYSNRYVTLARKIGMRYRVRIGSTYAESAIHTYILGLIAESGYIKEGS